MSLAELPLAVCSLLLSVAAGLLVHELAHAAALRASGIPCDLEWFPEGAGLLGGGPVGRWATVTPRRVPADVAPWRLRAAAMAPVSLTFPLALVALGAVPDPLATGGLALQLAVVGWLACAVPSPQDFSVLWYAERALPTTRGGAAAS
jgi:hypothetical protein